MEHAMNDNNPRSGQARQKERLRAQEDAIRRRIENAPYGEKTKALAHTWTNFESFGGAGLGLFDVVPIIERAEGPFLYDADGKEYLDFLSGFSVSALGNNNKEIADCDYCAERYQNVPFLVFFQLQLLCVSGRIMKHHVYQFA